MTHTTNAVLHDAYAADYDFAFTTRLPVSAQLDHLLYERQTAGKFEIFAHAPAYVEAQLAQYAFKRLKLQKCFVGDDVFLLWVAPKT